MALTGRGCCGARIDADEPAGEGAFAAELDVGGPDEADGPAPLAEKFAAIDAVIARSTRILEGETLPAVDKSPSAAGQPPRNSLVYDLDWDENARLSEWQDVFTETRDLPAVLRAAILLEAWTEIEVLLHATWLGAAVATPTRQLKTARPGRARAVTTAGLQGSDPGPPESDKTGRAQSRRPTRAARDDREREVSRVGDFVINLR